MKKLTANDTEVILQSMDNENIPFNPRIMDEIIEGIEKLPGKPDTTGRNTGLFVMRTAVALVILLNILTLFIVMKNNSNTTEQQIIETLQNDVLIEQQQNNF